MDEKYLERVIHVSKRRDLMIKLRQEQAAKRKFDSAKVFFQKEWFIYLAFENYCTAAQTVINVSFSCDSQYQLSLVDQTKRNR